MTIYTQHLFIYFIIIIIIVCQKKKYFAHLIVVDMLFKSNCANPQKYILIPAYTVLWRNRINTKRKELICKALYVQYLLYWNIIKFASEWEWCNRKCLPFHQDIMNLNPGDAIAICGQELKRAKLKRKKMCCIFYLYNVWWILTWQFIKFFSPLYTVFGNSHSSNEAQFY